MNHIALVRGFSVTEIPCINSRIAVWLVFMFEADRIITDLGGIGIGKIGRYGRIDRDIIIFYYGQSLSSMFSILLPKRRVYGIGRRNIV